jgi:hypothetical protein
MAASFAFTQYRHGSEALSGTRQPSARSGASWGAASVSFRRAYLLEFSAFIKAYEAPETLGEEQFFRQRMVLPWKSGNLSPLRRDPPSRDRIDAGDPAWGRVDALAATLGYAA